MSENTQQPDFRNAAEKHFIARFPDFKKIIESEEFLQFWDALPKNGEPPGIPCSKNLELTLTSRYNSVNAFLLYTLEMAETALREARHES